MATDYSAEKFILEGKLCLTWDTDKRDKFSEFQGDAPFLGLPVPGESGMKASLDGETRGRSFGPRRPPAPTASALAPMTTMTPFRSWHGLSLVEGTGLFKELATFYSKALTLKLQTLWIAMYNGEKFCDNTTMTSFLPAAQRHGHPNI